MTGTESETETFHRRCKKRETDLLEHRPHELRISVNGQIMAGQMIRGSISEQSLNVNLREPVDFVEVFSEQELRLLFFDLRDRSTWQEHRRLELSDRRTLEAQLDFNDSTQTIQIVYSDPGFGVVAATNLDEVPKAVQNLAPSLVAAESKSIGLLNRFLERLSAFSQFLLQRPIAITAVLVAALVAAILLVRVNNPTVAAELLSRATNAEQLVAADSKSALHRKFYLEQKSSIDNRTTRRRVETWQSAHHAAQMTRLFDENNNLVAAAQTKSDGTRKIYSVGTDESNAENKPAIETLQNDEAWLLDMSSAEFIALVGDLNAVNVQELNDSYLLTYDRQEKSSGLKRATLKLNKWDLHAIDQELEVATNDVTRYYHFIEIGYERVPVESVGPAVFEPDPQFRTGTTSETNVSPALGPGETRNNAAPSLASAELEIEVSYLLNRVRADLGEQISVTRTHTGALLVHALVESEGRKRELLEALSPVSRNPAVVINIKTVEEAAKSQTREGHSATTVEEVEAGSRRIAADAELRRYFGSRGFDQNRLDQEIERFANRAIGHSRQALLHASALKRLAAKFSPAEIEGLAPDAQKKLRAMLSGHAQGHQREMHALRMMLRPVFGDGGSANAVAVSRENLTESVERLLQSTYSTDGSVRSAFTISTRGGNAARIQSADFWRTVKTAEALSIGIQNASK